MIDSINISKEDREEMLKILEKDIRKLEVKMRFFKIHASVGSMPPCKVSSKVSGLEQEVQWLRKVLASL